MTVAGAKVSIGLDRASGRAITDANVWLPVRPPD